MFLYSSISLLVQFFGMAIAFPHTKALLEKGLVIKKESHDFSFLYLEEANPIGIIGTCVTLDILIMPSETFWLGPLGPSGVIPIHCEFFNNVKTGLSDIVFSFYEVGILLSLKYFPTIAPNRPSLWPDANILILLSEFQQ